ncbi:MAG: hypothetical protein ACXVB1_00250 [Pseudobdellovibrionaceae bacterium]
MKVKFVQTTVADKKQVKVGEVMELKDTEAKFLINLGRAVEVKEAPPVEPEKVSTKTKKENEK